VSKLKTITITYRVRGAQLGSEPEFFVKELDVLAQYGQIVIHLNPYFESGDDKSPVGKSMLFKYTAVHVPTKLGVLYSNNLGALKVQARVLEETFSDHEDWKSDDYLRSSRVPGLKDVVNAFKDIGPSKRWAALEVCAKTLERVKGATNV
jgi:hypothetical protein